MSDFDRDRDDSGRFGGEAYPDSAFTEAVRELQLPTTGDVAREIGCSRSTAWERLGELEDRGVVDGSSVGSATVWEHCG